MSDGGFCHYCQKRNCECDETVACHFHRPDPAYTALFDTLIAALEKEKTMSIYCTLWELRFPADGLAFNTDEDLGVVVFAQAVPSHIQDTGEQWAFLPPPVEEFSPYHRAVIITTPDDEKGTARNGQEYYRPLLVLTGKEYEAALFDGLYERICETIQERQPR